MLSNWSWTQQRKPRTQVPYKQTSVLTLCTEDSPETVKRPVTSSAQMVVLNSISPRK